MSFPSYPNYKESGVEWLGQVPEHWDVLQFKQLLEIQNGADHKLVEQEEGYPVIGSGGVFAYASDYLYDGESVLLGRKGTIDKPLYVSGRFWTVDTMYWTKIRSETSGRFAYYSALTIPFSFYSTNTALPSMTKGNLSSHLVARPPLTEQTAIADFLDRETAKIDELVAEQQKLIELLKEKRQAVISHAVTKGLNPDAPMKDSGIEWLGQVPAHWEVKNIKYFAQILRGKFTHRPRNDPSFYNGEYPFIQTGDITGTSKYITEYKQTLNEKGIAVSKEFPRGTLVMAIAANIGDVAILDFPAYFPDSIVGFFPTSKVSVMFLYHLLGSMKEAMLRTATISTQMNLNIDQISSLKAGRPPLFEQAAISGFLQKETDKVNALIAEAQKAILLLQERRSALISAAVTGQIDVRTTQQQEAS